MFYLPWHLIAQHVFPCYESVAHSIMAARGLRIWLARWCGLTVRTEDGLAPTVAGNFLSPHFLAKKRRKTLTIAWLPESLMRTPARSNPRPPLQNSTPAHPLRIGPAASSCADINPKSLSTSYFTKLSLNIATIRKSSRELASTPMIFY